MLKFDINCDIIKIGYYKLSGFMYILTQYERIENAMEVTENKDNSTIRHYILTRGYALRGWMLLPYALQYLYRPKTEFFYEDKFDLLQACDGQTDIRWDEFSSNCCSLTR